MKHPDPKNKSLTGLPRQKEINRVLFITFLLNLLVSAGKLLVGVFIHSLSMVADGIHSLVDASSNIVGFISVYFASKPADEDHPYGHQKFEVVAALGIALLMGVTCVEILRTAYGRFLHAQALVDPTPAAFGVMLVTMGINSWVSWYESKKGMELHSAVLSADSAHTRSDILASFPSWRPYWGPRWVGGGWTWSLRFSWWA